MDKQTWDVLVAGGGVAGVCAAVAAARAGATTLIVERNGFFGGAATAGAVPQFIGWKTESGRQVIYGIAQEIVDRLVAMGASPGFDWFTMSTGLRMDRVEFDPEACKIVLDQIVMEAGATPLFNAVVSDVETRGRTIVRGSFLTKSGTIDIHPRMVIDASGDLDVLVRAGCAFLPLEDGEVLQPATMSFRMGPIDFARFTSLTTEEKRAMAERGVKEGGLGRFALHCNRVPGTDEGWFNVTRIVVDGTDAFALSAAEAEGRRQAYAAARFIAANVPGCERARLSGLAPSLGIRETRRVKGRAVVDEDDLRSGRMFEDAIALAAYPLDIHATRSHETRIERVGREDHCYSIPLRALIPDNLDNALTAGRGLSATHTAFSALRVMPPSMAMGQAAGVAAAMAAKRNAPPAELPYDELRAALIEGGALIP